MPQRATRRKFWGWGLEGEGLTASEIEQLGGTFAGRWGIDAVRVLEPPRVDELDLRAPRLSPPASLEAAFSTEPYERAAHTYGRSFRDLVRAFRRDYTPAPGIGSSRSCCVSAAARALLAPHQRLPRCPAVRLAWPRVCRAWLVRCVRVAGACRGEILPLAVWRPRW